MRLPNMGKEREIISGISKKERRELVKKHIIPGPYGGITDARLRESRVPIWALISHLKLLDWDVARATKNYGVSEEEMIAALAFYSTPKYGKYIKAKILVTSDLCDNIKVSFD